MPSLLGVLVLGACLLFSSLVAHVDGFVAPALGNIQQQRSSKSVGILATPQLAQRITPSSPAQLHVDTRSVVSMAAAKGASEEALVIPPDFKLGAGFVLFGLLLISAFHNYGSGIPCSIIGIFLTVQATRVRFVFDGTSMEVKLGGEGEELTDSGENFAVGGANRWAYDTWTNWEVFPNFQLPILVYFKETQTSPSGQIHFFPMIMNPDMLISTIRERVKAIPTSERETKE